MTKFTLEPWYMKAYRHPNSGRRITSYTIEIVETDEYLNTVIGEVYGPNESDMKGNAYLITAAQDMLEALEIAEATIERLNHHGSADGTLDVIRAASAKARGGSPHD